MTLFLFPFITCYGISYSVAKPLRFCFYKMLLFHINFLRIFLWVCSYQGLFFPCYFLKDIFPLFLAFNVFIQVCCQTTVTPLKMMYFLIFDLFKIFMSFVFHQFYCDVCVSVCVWVWCCLNRVRICRAS